MQLETRAEELALIEAASGKSEPWEEEIQILLTLFDLPEAYLECLLDALRSQKWRGAAHPLLTLKRSVLSAAFAHGANKNTRTGVALGLSEEKLGQIFFRQSTLTPTRRKNGDGVWRAGRGMNPDCEAKERESTLPLTERLRGESSSIKLSDIADALERAGLDELETAYVLGYLGRKRARAKFAASVQDRRTAEATVKRVQRKLPRVRRILRGE